MYRGTEVSIEICVLQLEDVCYLKFVFSSLLSTYNYIDGLISIIV